MASLSVRYAKSGPRPGAALGYGLSAEVFNSDGMSGKIFMIKRSVPSVTDPEMQTFDVLDEFSHVASVDELQTIPEGSPDFDKSGSWYRTNYWEFSFRDTQDLEDSLSLLRKDIEKLVKSVNSNLKVQTYLEETYE